MGRSSALEWYPLWMSTWYHTPLFFGQHFLAGHVLIYASINVTNEDWFYNCVLHGIKTPPQEAKITREIKTGIQEGLQHAQSPLRR